MRILIRLAALLCLTPAAVLAAPLVCPPMPPASAGWPPELVARLHGSAPRIGRVTSIATLTDQLHAGHPGISAELLHQGLLAAQCRYLLTLRVSDPERVARWDAARHEDEMETRRRRVLAAARELSQRQVVVPPSRLQGLAGPTHTRAATGSNLSPPATAAMERAPPPPGAPPGPPGPPPAPAAAIPQFPWPPPPPSAQKIIPGGILLARIREVESHTGKVLAVNGRLHLRDVDAVLRRSLRGAGYEYRYYGAPRGFVMVARLERITDNGRPFPASKRFDASLNALDQFTLVGYLKALFLAPPGHYRVIALVLSPEPFRAVGRPVSADEASAWLEGGVNVLPREIGDLELRLPDYACTALVYEFEKRDTQTNPIELHPGRLSADTHLAASGIAELLWKRLYP